MLKENIIFWGLCATLIYLPLPFGGVEEWSIFAFEVAICILSGIHFLGRKLDKKNSQVIKDDKAEEFRFPPKVPAILKILLMTFLAIAILQLLPLPASFLKYFSPQTLEIYNKAHQAAWSELSGGGWKTLSFSPVLTLYELMKYICYALFGYLVFQHVRTKKKIEMFILIIIICGVFQSFYGLAEYLAGTKSIFGWKNRWNLGTAFGTFVNRDHFSGFLEMTFPLSVGYLLAKTNFFVMRKGLSFKEKILWFAEERLQKAIILGGVSALMGIGIFFSRSRSGILIFIISIFLMAVAVSLGNPGQKEAASRKKTFLRIIPTMALVILFSLALFGIKPFIQNFSREPLSLTQGRPIYYKNTISLIKKYPLFGTGSGTYVHAYTMFEKIYDSHGVLVHAHNDYLEVLAESGLIGGGSLILLALGALGYIFWKWMKRRDHFARGTVLGCMAGITAILIHSLTDFNLRIPANAVYFITFYSLGMRTVITKRKG